VNGIRAARKKARENAPATCRRRREPGTNKLMNNVVITSTVNRTKQYSAYSLWVRVAGACVVDVGGSRCVIWFSLC
jgi:hypothetical protein